MVKIEISDIDIDLKTACEKMGFLKSMGFEPYFERSPLGEVKIIFIKTENIRKVPDEKIEDKKLNDLGIEFLE